MLRPLVDILMTILLLLSMSYEMTGPAISETLGKFLPFTFDGYEYGSIIHEILGSALIVLFFIHLWLNRWWIKTLFTGRYNVTRIILTLVNILLIADVILLTLSGLIMSRMFDEFQFADGLMSFARSAHISASFAGYVIMSFHVGLNWHIFSAMMFKRWKPGKILPHVTAVAFRIWGVYAFIRRNIWEYMTLKSAFVFFDFDEPFMYFIGDYVAVMILFACIGHYMYLALRKLKI